METRPAPGYTSLVPMLPVTDVARTIAFYEQLGFRIGRTFAPGEDGVLVWAWLYRGGAHLMVNRAERPVAATHVSASLWVYGEDVQATHALLQERGLDVGELTYPPYNAGGEFHVHDPDGYAVFIAQASSP